MSHPRQRREIGRQHRVGEDKPVPGEAITKLLDDLATFVQKYKLYLLAGGVAYLYTKNISEE